MRVLNPTLEHRLIVTAHALGRPAQDLLDEAVVAYLQDLQHSRVAEEVCRQLDADEEKTTTWTEVEKRLGLTS
jgi:predicted DNA-binding protein